MEHYYNGFLIERNTQFIIVEIKENTFTKIIKCYFPNEFAHSVSLANEQEKVHLLFCFTTEEQDTVTAKYIIFEPDFLVDISAVAECIHEYGASPFFYLLNKTRKKENTRFILLGNAANFFLDEILHSEDIANIDFTTLLRAFFRRFAVELAACKDLKDRDQEVIFFQDLRKHFDHLSSLVQELFLQLNIQRKTAILEPSFLSPQLGLQGRLDFLEISENRTTILELKSGKAPFPENDTHLIGTNHLTQAALYQIMIQIVLDIDVANLDTYICYSRYTKDNGLLRKSIVSDTHIAKALDLRNQIVLLDKALCIGQISPVQYFQGLRPENMIEAVYIDTKFIQNYIAPPIYSFSNWIKKLNELEKAYFFSNYIFITREIMACKLSSDKEIFTHSQSSLWLQTIEEKVKEGRILKDLYLVEIETMANGMDLLHFELDALTITNADFREGDIVVLYKKTIENIDIRAQQIIKGTIISWQPDKITIGIRNKQNQLVLPLKSYYHAEHDYLDVNNANMFRSLCAFMQMSETCKSIIFQPNISIVKEETILKSIPPTIAIENIVRRAKSANELFLIVGPPGTGKTSIALKSLVEEFYIGEKKSILLVAYTNKAVDEICHSIATIVGLDYIRLGTMISCAERFRPHLLETKISDCKNRAEVQSVLQNCNIYVGTLAALASRNDLFKLKHFDIAIVDEASQILEPQLLGLFSAENDAGEKAINKFIFIGDHKQLPAVVSQNSDEKLPPILVENGWTDLKQSYFERIYRKFKGNENVVAELSIQGRMHEEIAHLANTLFYGSQLACVPLMHQNGQLPTMKYNTSDNYQKIVATERIHFFPYAKAETVIFIIQNICAAIHAIYQENQLIFNTATVGIIAPYKDIITKIKAAISELSIPDLRKIDIDTVERYQGAQKDIILFAMGIENEKQLLQQTDNCIEMDGVTIDRKLNVAITRARKQLFIVGNEQLISTNEIYYRMLSMIKTKNPR